MGIRKLGEIVSEVSNYRRSTTPIAVMQNGTINKESCTMGTLGSLAKMISDVDISKPGIIVIGDVVAEHPSFFRKEVQRVLHSSL